jgi:hypothetical protein
MHRFYVPFVLCRIVIVYFLIFLVTAVGPRFVLLLVQMAVEAWSAGGRAHHGDRGSNIIGRVPRDAFSEAVVQAAEISAAARQAAPPTRAVGLDQFVVGRFGTSAVAVDRASKSEGETCIVSDTGSRTVGCGAGQKFGNWSIPFAHRATTISTTPVAPSAPTTDAKLEWSDHKPSVRHPHHPLFLIVVAIQTSGALPGGRQILLGGCQWFNAKRIIYVFYFILFNFILKFRFITF